MLIGINKPFGEVTRSVDNHVARLLGDDGVGHIGTLDPAVTGVLVMAVGQARKLIRHIEDGKRKVYVATIAFGHETDTDDGQGAATRVAPVPEQLANPGYARSVLGAFEGEQLQRPPRFSAIKVDGVRAYDLARSGVDFELPERAIHVYRAALIEVLEGDETRWRCEFEVSGGTYVRALARDIGRACGSAAHLAGLCRTASGRVSLADCVPIEEVERLGVDGLGTIALDPARVLGLPCVELTDEELERAKNGSRLRIDDERAAGVEGLVSIVHGSRLYGVWSIEDGLATPQTNCPAGVEGVRA